ncbi:MAG: hypothetical protein Q8P59_08760, partial [Dehalococcoidia bacterium]|nr:hypothetical protein [Dehalococcoidia bacterium]
GAAAAGSGLGSAMLKSFLMAGAGTAGSGLAKGIGQEMFPQSQQMPLPPQMGLLSAPMASELGVPSYKRIQGSLVIPQGGPKARGGSQDDLEKLMLLLRQQGRL